MKKLALFVMMTIFLVAAWSCEKDSGPETPDVYRYELYTDNNTPFHLAYLEDGKNMEIQEEAYAPWEKTLDYSAGQLYCVAHIRGTDRITLYVFKNDRLLDIRVKEGENVWVKYQTFTSDLK